MHQVNMHEAKSQLSTLVNEALAGEEVIIAKAGVPVVKLIPFLQDTRSRKPGRYKGQITIAPDFDQTASELLDAFEGTSE